MSKSSNMSDSKASKATDIKGKLRFLRHLVPSFCSFGHHHALMMVLLISLIFLSLLLAGCSSSSGLIPTIFLLSISYQKSTPTPDPAQVDYAVHTAISNVVGNAQLQVRVGYFGLCFNPDGSGNSWLCSNNATTLAYHISVDEDPLNLIWVASRFKETLVISYLLVAALVLAVLCILLLLTFPAWQKEKEMDVEGGKREVKRKRFPSPAVSQAGLFIVLLASTFVFISVLWQYTASVAASTIARDFANGSVVASVGTASMVVGCFTFALFVAVGSGLLAMVISKKALPSSMD